MRQQLTSAVSAGGAIASAALETHQYLSNTELFRPAGRIKFRSSMNCSWNRKVFIFLKSWDMLLLYIHVYTFIEIG